MEIISNISFVLIRIEILIFIVSLGYAFYYVFDNFYSIYRVSQNKKRQRLEKRKKRLEKHKTQKEVKTTIPSPSPVSSKKITHTDSEKLRDTLKRVQVNKARGYLETARSLIIEGLTIDKDNYSLNMELGEIYELEGNYNKAEYIYRDMLASQSESYVLLKKLGNTLSLQGKNIKAVKEYEKAFEKKKDDEETLDVLSNLFFDLKNFKKCLKYAKLFLKNSPRDIEKLGMKGYCLEKQSKNKEAVECYQKILNLQPYNSEVKERIQKLQS